VPLPQRATQTPPDSLSITLWGILHASAHSHWADYKHFESFCFLTRNDKLSAYKTQVDSLISQQP
jgi:hypothetical protein